MSLQFVLRKRGFVDVTAVCFKEETDCYHLDPPAWVFWVVSFHNYFVFLKLRSGYVWCYQRWETTVLRRDLAGRERQGR